MDCLICLCLETHLGPFCGTTEQRGLGEAGSHSADQLLRLRAQPAGAPRLPSFPVVSTRSLQSSQGWAREFHVKALPTTGLLSAPHAPKRGSHLESGDLCAAKCPSSTLAPPVLGISRAVLQ